VTAAPEDIGQGVACVRYSPEQRSLGLPLGRSLQVGDLTTPPWTLRPLAVSVTARIDYSHLREQSDDWRGVGAAATARPIWRRARWRAAKTPGRAGTPAEPFWKGTAAEGLLAPFLAAMQQPGWCIAALHHHEARPGLFTPPRPRRG